MNVYTCSGNIGKDAETKHTPNGKAVTRFPLAVASGFGDRKSTFWLNCTLWEREKVAEYFTKGMKITVSGELNNREWEDKEGNKRLSLELTVRDFDLPPRSRVNDDVPEESIPF